jgi:hypothetical protein
LAARLACTASNHFGNPGNDVVQAFDMLDVESRVDVDPGGEQFLDIHVALGMPALRRIAVRKLVDQNEARLPGQNGVKVHFGKCMGLIGDTPARDDFEPLKQRPGLAAMRLDDADDDVNALYLFCPRRGQHFIGLADAGRGAEKDLQAAPLRLLHFTQESIWRRRDTHARRRAASALLGERVEREVEF